MIPATPTSLGRFLVAAVVLICAACEEKVDLVRVFTIPAGEHYASPRIVETLQSTRLEFDAMFDESAIYLHEQSGFQDSKNKLMGFSDCNSLHHKNSARFVWQWFNDRIEIYAYCYVDGVRIEEYVGVADINRFHRYSITLEPDSYRFSMDGQHQVRIGRGATCETGVYYKLWPYFGGSVPAPHTVRIHIREH
jgi:hypothetical protein